MADAVSQLQCQINTLCELMFNYAGTLQRDARPANVSANGDLDDALPEGGITKAELEAMAGTIAEARRVIVEIARALPEMDTDENASRKRLAALHAEHEKVSKELDIATAEAREELEIINAAFKKASEATLFE
ncbi:Mediator complex, subunit Med21 [Ostreococcus tauri]|uniref:Mediator of RNA polymerase II transcription subunit 21 n=1 Tax=Ostreococcus tauri TaxID=70448 RepID=A0A096PB18_OSTTA|nr:Mediator complex, subunit Med21 [Ostreococcus tauri]OUS45547.1 hypothetical protein BE221DRAFT_195719 [Ostreococcus tauri]CEG01805.1 Mediator complex, subunit Med21 [Ostreococcus tauri]|eukprot:XP_022841180.1 Mediator complex, subunit Med21 [Ostreococcus tauri]